MNPALLTNLRMITFLDFGHPKHTVDGVTALTYGGVTAVSSDDNNSETVCPNHLKFGVARDLI